MYTNLELHQIISEQADLWGIELTHLMRDLIFSKIAFSDQPHAEANTELLKIKLEE